jgi:hypothetical protein
MGQRQGVGKDKDEGVRPQASTAVSPVSIAEAIKTFWHRPNPPIFQLQARIFREVFDDVV